MVKNTKGGSNHKKQARKHSGNTVSHTKKLRFPEDPLELYALCIKVMGNCKFEVLSQDGETLLCHLPRKFSGRSKRDNMVILGSYLLVGKREYESRKANSRENCDLLEVYNAEEVKKLEQSVSHNCWKLFKANLPNKEENVDEEDDIFYNEKEMELNSILEKMGDTSKEEVKMSTENNSDSDIDIDDI